MLVGCLPSHLLYMTGSFLAHLIRGEGVPYFLAKIEVLRTLPAVLRKRSEIQKKRRVSARELRKKFFKGWFRHKLAFVSRKR
jgi:hypothetical protein